MDNLPTKSTLREPEQKHRQQFVWQILVPLLVVAFISIAAIIIMILSERSGPLIHPKFAMVSTVLLALLWLILNLVPLALAILGIWLLSKSEKSITPYLFVFSVYLDRLRKRFQIIADGAASPFIQARSANAGVRQLFSNVFHQKPSSKE